MRREGSKNWPRAAWLPRPVAGSFRSNARRYGPRRELAASAKERAWEPPGTGTSARDAGAPRRDRKSTRLNSSHRTISYAVFCLKKKKRKKELKIIIYTI